jgi:hypothetical protein
MKKSDLKTGMMVEYNNGNRAIVIQNVDTKKYGYQNLFFAEDGCFMTGEGYNEDLICRVNHGAGYTIKKVYAPSSESHILRKSLEGRRLLWEREPQPIEMTLEEACKKLRDTMGQPVKITI